MKTTEENPPPSLRRVHVFQFTDTRWFPRLFVSLIHEFLVWFIRRTNAAKPFLPLLRKALKESGNSRVIDIHTGVGSGISHYTESLAIEFPIQIAKLDENFWKDEGVLLIPNGFHRFRPHQAQAFLRKAVENKRTLLIVEGNNDNWWQAVGMLVFSPLSSMLATPFVRPFRWSRLLFTYLIPVIPLTIAVDGMAALFRLYPPKDLDSLWSTIQSDNYEWTSGKLPNGRGGKIMFGLAHPKR